MSPPTTTEQAAQSAKLRSTLKDSSGNAVLAGVRVLDFGRYIAGPFCSAMLADLGAEVIRIEPPGGADDRYVMPLAHGREGALHLQVNRNKRSLVLDMSSSGGREISRRLLASADIVVVNLPPAARTKLGLDYDTLRALKPDIILTTVTAYGTGSSQADRIGFDGMGQALSGAIHLTGTIEQPFRSAVSFVDYATAMAAAFGTLAAVVSRNQTGEGQHVEASLLATALSMTNPMLIEEATGSRSRVPTGNRSPISGPSDLFATEDGWIFVQVIGQEMFERWIELVGAHDLRGDARFSDDMGRGQNGEVLSERTRQWCAGRLTEDCLSALHRARVPGYPVLSPANALKAPEIADGGYFHWLKEQSDEPPVPLVRPLVRLSQSPEPKVARAPALGADTRAILAELGFGEPEIATYLRQFVSGESVETTGASRQ